MRPVRIPAGCLVCPFQTDQVTVVWGWLCETNQDYVISVCTIHFVPLITLSCKMVVILALVCDIDYCFDGI